MATRDDVVAIAPELATESTERMDYFLAMASLRVSSSAWGSKQNMAHALMTAHMLTLTNRGKTGAVGPVSSQSVGGVSVVYGSASSFGGSEYDQTVYGQMFLQLRKGLPITPVVLNT